MLILSAALFVVFGFHPPTSANWGNDHISDSANTLHFAVWAECIVMSGSISWSSKLKLQVESIYLAALEAI